MGLYRLAAATILRKKAWVIAGFAVGALPFLLPLVSTAAENPILVEPTRAQTAWTMLWIAALFWGLFAGARLGEQHNRSGLGEYFLTAGISATRQLSVVWLAVMSFLAPLALLAMAVCLLGAMPARPDEQAMWLATNLQYAALFLLVLAPLVALATALASRFGATAGYVLSLGLGLYGLYGVGYLDMLFRLESNPVLEWAWLGSPHFHFADITNRLIFKLGALETRAFLDVVLYLAGILCVAAALSRVCFRTRSFS
jgi:hypothetical protein